MSPRRGSPTGGDNGAYFKVKGRNAVLTPAGQRLMEKFNMDPKNAADVRMFIQSNR